jgi:hypothetical protein
VASAVGGRFGEGEHCRVYCSARQGESVGDIRGGVGADFGESSGGDVRGGHGVVDAKGGCDGRER